MEGFDWKGITHFLSFDTTRLKAYSQAYILMTRIPVMISFIIRTLLSVILADLNLKEWKWEGECEGGREGGREGGGEREKERE